jgi:undecaprenyl phosphate-alpha-L-ara4N flippase subunit ArnE
MKIALAFVAMISFTVLANLLMKTGADGLAGPGSFWMRVLSWKLAAGLAAFGVAALLYVLILSWLPLNVAQSFAAAQFIAVILASRLVLDEPIGSAQWLGIALIAGGIAIVGWSRS